MDARTAWEAVRYECQQREACRGCGFWALCHKTPSLWTDEDIKRAEGQAEKLADEPEKDPAEAEREAPTYAEVFARMHGADPVAVSACRNVTFGKVGICALAWKYPALGLVQRRREARITRDEDACRACWAEKCRSKEGKR